MKAVMPGKLWKVQASEPAHGFRSESPDCASGRIRTSRSWSRDRTWDSPVSREATQWMIDKYPAEIREWINSMGGIEKMPQTVAPQPVWWVLPASILWQMGYRRCN
jgi:hypothetical protein